jgi:hypothetical protein
MDLQRTIAHRNVISVTELPPPLLTLRPCRRCCCSCCCCRYVSGRTRAPGEINGKSGNLNNCLRNVIYADFEEDFADIPAQELVVVFDADMACKRHFFLKVLEVMWDEETALCLTPQVSLKAVISGLLQPRCI